VIIYTKKQTNNLACFYFNNSFHSPAYFVAKKSIISHRIAHSSANQNGEYPANIVPSINMDNWSYVKNTNTIFNHAQISNHLIQKGIEQFNTGCLSINHIRPTTTHRVVYQNRIQILKNRSEVSTKYGIEKKPTSQNTNHKDFEMANLEPNLFLNILII
jgi:hypothetical protein